MESNKKVFAIGFWNMQSINRNRKSSMQNEGRKKKKCCGLEWNRKNWYRNQNK